MSPEEAAVLIEKDARNADVLFPYLNGKNLNDSPTQTADRWAINFLDWPRERAARYVECFEVVERLVYPERLKVKRAANRERWWLYAENRPGLRAAVMNLDRVLARAITGKHHAFAFVTPQQVIDQTAPVYVYDDDGHFGVLQSDVHRVWWTQWGSTMRTDLRYTPSDVFETFPQPTPQTGPIWERVDAAGRTLNEFRTALMARTALGLTKTYNRFNDAAELRPEYRSLRELHVALDYAVRDAYGWTDLELDHHHWVTPQGMRFTVSPAAKGELLDRLLELNHQRYAEEVAAGLHDKKSKKAPAKRAKAVDSNQESML